MLDGADYGWFMCLGLAEKLQYFFVQDCNGTSFSARTLYDHGFYELN